MQALLELDPEAAGASALLEAARPGEPVKWRSPDRPDERVAPAEELSIDGLHMRVVRYPWGPRLQQAAGCTCDWYPKIEYVGTVLSVVLLNGRIFEAKRYEGLIRDGGYGDQGFGCWVLESLDEYPATNSPSASSSTL